MLALVALPFALAFLTGEAVGTWRRVWVNRVRNASKSVAPGGPEHV